MSYFDFCTGLTMTSQRFHDLFGGPPRKPDQLLTPYHMDLAASIQAVTEEIVLRLTRSLCEETGIRNLCLAGGVALNCVANGKVLRDACCDRIWIQPAAGDAGGALGAALAGYHLQLGRARTANGDAMKGSFLGPAFTQREIEDRLTRCGARFEVLADSALIATGVEDLARSKALGWFQGRMEFGPRALGNRSILGDPRSPTMQKTLNLKIKYRESFRPFAPSVLRERVSDWFEMNCDSPYMLLVADVVQSRRREMSDEEKQLFGIDKLNVPRSEIPAVTHVDYSARVQTVHEDTNPRYILAVSSENPVAHFQPNVDYLYSSGWNFSIRANKRSNNYGYINLSDYHPEDATPLLMVIGDSFVESHSIDAGKSAAEILNAAVDGKGRVYSIGLSGAPLSQYLVFAEFSRTTFRPNAMVFVIIGNDF